MTTYFPHPSSSTSGKYPAVSVPTEIYALLLSVYQLHDILLWGPLSGAYLPLVQKVRSSNGLRKLTKDHASYLQGVEDLNSSLAEIVGILGDINPEELESRIKALEQKASDIHGQVKRSEVITTAAVNRVFYFSLTTVFFGACAFI